MNAIQNPTQGHALCACDDPAFKAQIAGLQAMTATLNNSARHCEADSIYQNYCFGDGVQVAGQDGWEYTTPGDVWTRKVYVETEDSEASQKLNFTIRFGTGDAPEAYAIDSKGNIWGTQE